MTNWLPEQDSSPTIPTPLATVARRNGGSGDVQTEFSVASFFDGLTGERRRRLIPSPSPVYRLATRAILRTVLAIRSAPQTNAMLYNEHINLSVTMNINVQMNLWSLLTVELATAVAGAKLYFANSALIPKEAGIHLIADPPT